MVDGGPKKNLLFPCPIKSLWQDNTKEQMEHHDLITCDLFLTHYEFNGSRSVTAAVILPSNVC